MFDPNILSQVSERCSRFSGQTGIEVTQQTQELIATILTSIILDQHPSWELREEPNNIAQAYIEATPLFLRQIFVGEHIPRITTFSFLHWFSRIFEPMMCAIPKRPL
jgi:hypothetical protein